MIKRLDNTAQLIEIFSDYENVFNDVMECVSVPSGQVIFQQNDQSNDLYVVESGEVEIIKRTKTGKEHVIACIGKGESFGDMAFLGDESRTATARAKSWTGLKLLNKSKLLNHAQGYEIYNKLIASIAKENILRLKKSNYDKVQVMESQIAALKEQMDFGRFFVYIIVLYTICLIVNQLLHSYLSFVSIYSLEFFIVYAVILLIPSFIIIYKQGIPIDQMGITLENWKVSLKEGVIVSLAYVVVFACVMWVLQTHYGKEFKSDYLNPLMAPLYLIHTFFQELFARGVIQNSFQRFFKDNKGQYSILMSSIMFGLFHIHFGMVAVLVMFTISLFFGWFYLRHRNLIGVTLVHFVMGTSVFGSGIM